MSLPPELRVLCFQLSSTPVADLPRLTPTLLRHVLRCQVPLSAPLVVANKADAPASSVLVHKLKTQLSTLLNGRSPEGRFTAVVLIKAVVEVGGLEVLTGAESWVRGLLSVLGKPESTVTKEMCIISLTKIYFMTLPYQTLMREITTPTLPAFITSCLNLIAPKNSDAKAKAPVYLEEAVLKSFALLLPRHPTMFRPFVNQIRSVTGVYLAPTSSDALFVPYSLKSSARRLFVLCHHTAAKNTGGEEWAKSVRELITSVHVTADGVFRAVIEDWESTAGYVGSAVDVNTQLKGGVTEGLPPWEGIYSGLERLTGLLELLAEFVSCKTPMPVTIPLGLITDLMNRMLSIVIPLGSETSKGDGIVRLHPAIDREERDALWAGLPQIYVASLQIIGCIADVLQEGFISLAPGTLDQLSWSFSSGKVSSSYRTIAYQVAAKILQSIGRGFDKTQVHKIAPLVRSCCKDLSFGPNFETIGSLSSAENPKASQNNVETLLSKKSPVSQSSGDEETEISLAARELLPLLLSKIPQQFVDISLRSLIERTAILSSNKDAMLASILNPFIGKNGKTLPTILPHLSREFPNDDMTEILLRPRMPPIPSAATGILPNDIAEESEDEVMDDDELVSMQEDTVDSRTIQQNINKPPTAINGTSSIEVHQPGIIPANISGQKFSSQKATKDGVFAASSKSADEFLARNYQSSTPNQPKPPAQSADTPMAENLDSSDDESVHLTMQLDTDSEDE